MREYEFQQPRTGTRYRGTCADRVGSVEQAWSALLAGRHAHAAIQRAYLRDPRGWVVVAVETVEERTMQATADAKRAAKDVAAAQMQPLRDVRAAQAETIIRRACHQQNAQRRTRT